MTIALRVLALDEEVLRGRNVGFTANSALHPLEQPLSASCQTRTCPVGARLRTNPSSYSDLRTDPRLLFGLRKPIAIHAEISLNMNLPE